jgi:hypothetical protein
MSTKKIGALGLDNSDIRTSELGADRDRPAALTGDI